IRVHPGHVGMFHANVAFELDRIKGIKNMFFGGDGIFLAKLTGPGHVWLQTLPLPKLAQSLMPYLPEASSGEGKSGGFNIGSLLDDN
ncbi:MAG TPA: AIM24 family protein, partial [Acidimicrobiia bacterium]|nr:AIM24 family protein [Acidimicrobiia bacterium]